MASRETRTVFQSFIGGMIGETTVDPRILPENTYSFGLNVTSRGGLPKTRPPFKDSNITFASGTKFQGGFTYRLNGVDRIVFGIDGKIYSLNLSTGTVTEHGLLLSPTVDRFFFVKADRFCIIQDGDKSTSYANANWPVILYEDTRIDQTDPADPYYQANDYNRVPKGGPMAFGHGRLFVATDYVLENETAGWVDNGRIGWMAGDIRLPHRPASMLEFIETWTFNEGGRFDITQELGFIYGMQFQHNMMTGTGAGPLMVFADNGAQSFQVNARRADWKAIDFSFVMFEGDGTRSHLSFVHNNSDILYRAHDGIRTLAQSSQQAQGSNLTNRAISSEMDIIFDGDDLGDEPKVSMAKHNHRVFCTSVPDTDGFKALVSLDLDALSTIGAPPSPIYDGIWTGFEFLSILEARDGDIERLYSFVKHQNGSFRLYYLDEDEYLDGTDSEPLCRVYTAAKLFEYPLMIKKIQHADIWLSDVKGDVTFTMYYRGDGFPLWSKMGSGTVRSDPAGLNMRYNKIRLVPLAVGNDPQFGELLDDGFAVQFCIEWTGKAKIDLVHVVAEAKDIDAKKIAGNLTTGDTVTADANAVQLDNYTYRVI